MTNEVLYDTQRILYLNCIYSIYILLCIGRSPPPIPSLMTGASSGKCMYHLTGTCNIIFCGYKVKHLINFMHDLCMLFICPNR